MVEDSREDDSYSGKMPFLGKRVFTSVCSLTSFGEEIEILVGKGKKVTSFF